MRNDEISFVETDMQCRRKVIAAGARRVPLDLTRWWRRQWWLTKKIKGPVEHDSCCGLRLHQLKSRYRIKNEAR